MVQILLLCMMLIQSASSTTTKPAIDNERVSVLDVSDSIPPQPTDAVVVALSGSAAFVPKGTALTINGHSFVIDLKTTLSRRQKIRVATKRPFHGPAARSYLRIIE